MSTSSTDSRHLRRVELEGQLMCITCCSIVHRAPSPPYTPSNKREEAHSSDKANSHAKLTRSQSLRIACVSTCILCHRHLQLAALAASSLKRFYDPTPTSFGKPHIHIYRREAHAVDAHQLSLIDLMHHCRRPLTSTPVTSPHGTRAVVTRTRKLSDSSVWRLCQRSAPASEMARPTRLIRQAARQLRHLTRANALVGRTWMQCSSASLTRPCLDPAV